MTPTYPGLPLTILSFILVIGPLVFVHEMGHYLLGRWFGVKAETFSIGFGREILGWTDKKGTRWKIGWLPLGGYVRFKGEMTVSAVSAQLTSGEDRSDSFETKPPWQRFLIVAAGPITNLALAIIIFIGAFSITGLPTTPPIIAGVVKNSVADEAGLLPHDHITAIDDRAIETFAELRAIVSLRPDQPVALTVDRGGRTLNIDVTPERRSEYGQSIGSIGIISGPYVLEKAGTAQVMTAAFVQTGDVISSMIVYLKQIVSGARSASEMGGPLKIAQISGEQVTAGWLNFLLFAALISINLGFINLLPVPMLDGGYLVLYAVEAVRRRPVSERVQEYALRVGLAMMVTLMLFVTANDLASFGLWSKLRGLIG
ncbi:RIP metalloprotease RseP [Allosphingosinicella vermicomposti]|uniref:RIP metalloprotease RseP n=1 Tax=Allosphingosinicella vermicomposti TaxID=614671 RepID=UPI000D1085EB|nr:RIP metalloprotease RseP [Allosphingosinicella vermicomposti]